MTRTTAPLFVSDRQLRGYKTLPVARGGWALDSGGFTELKDYGSWDHGPSPEEYADRVRRYRDEVGGLVWAAPQDWMCEPIIIKGGTVAGQRFVGTNLSVAEHQRRTIDNILHLRTIAPDVPFIPVLQGFSRDDYLTCIGWYQEAGIDLAAEVLVGLGSVCRRQATTEAAEIITAIRAAVPGIRLHGFGIKTSGLSAYGSLLTSSDSLAWSYAARRAAPLPGCVGHKNCANCARYAFRWREHLLASLARQATRPHRNSRRTSRSADVKVSRKLDTQTRLRLSAFRDEAARLERDTTIRGAHRSGTSVRSIAEIVDLSPARVGQIIASPPPEGSLLEQLRVLRQRWRVDVDPASRAAADQIVAHLVTDELVPNGSVKGMWDGC